MYTYEIVTPNENPDEIIISKTGKVSEFTLAKVKKHQEDLYKMLIEQKKMLEFTEAKISNIDSFHPDIAEMEEEKLHHASLYYELKQKQKVLAENVAEIQKGLVEYDTEVHEILDQLDLKGKVELVDFKQTGKTEMEEETQPVETTNGGEEVKAEEVSTEEQEP
jgi:hypothetical protein